MDFNTIAPLAAAGLGFVSVLLLGFAALGAAGNHGRSARLKRRLSGEAAEPAQGLARALASGARRLGERLGPKDEDELGKTAADLMRAGFTGGNAPAVFWGAKTALTLAGLLAGAGLRMLLPESAPAGAQAMAFVLPAAVCLYLPNLWLRTCAKNRRREIINAMPDCLDLLVVCVEAGMGLDQALSRVGGELRLTSPVLADELRTVSLELRAGKGRSDALRNLARRVAVDDITSLVTLIVQADAFGTSVAQTLRVYSDSLRTTRYQRAEEIAAKMPVKILFPLIFFILPALFVVIMGPAGLKLLAVFDKMG
ncbi:type II secretion system F family protein [Desulfocurvus sp. DL9XJH121]